MLLRPSTAALRSTRHLATLARPTTISASRAFSTGVSHQAEGDTGGVRSGGAAQGDAFSKREKASEDKYMREQESKKIQALREQIRQQRENMEKLDANLDELLKDREDGEKK